MTAQHDANLLRLRDAEAPGDRNPAYAGRPREDVILVPSLQAGALVAPGRQRFYAAGDWRQTRLGEYGEFDTRTRDLRAGWLWQAGSRWSGEVLLAQTQDNTPFEDILGSRRNVLTTDTGRVRASFRPRPDRRVSLSAARFVGENSEPTARAGDFDVRLGHVEIAAVTPLGNDLALAYEQTDSRLGEGSDSGFVPPATRYEVQRMDLAFGWFSLPRTRLSLRVGHTWLRFAAAERDVDGPSYRAELQWRVSGRTSVESLVTREFGGAPEAFYRSTLTERLNLQIQHRLGAKTMAGFAYNSRRVRYIPPAESGVPLFSRTDRFAEPRFALTWSPLDAASFELSFGLPRRDSTVDALDFSSRLTTLTARFRLYR